MKYLQSLYSNAVKLNRKNILDLLEIKPKAVLVDLGCDDGKFTILLAKKINTNTIIGIDIVNNRLKTAKKLGLNTIKSDLNNTLPFSNNSVDVINANQIIEHVGNLDKFMSEIYRVLKPKGYAIISTENASSWCNIFALLLGWQMFSLTNISSKSLGIGNPWALHRKEKLLLSSWTHKTILSIKGLIEFSKIWGFEVEKTRGAGYFPFPAFFGKIEVIHSHFITVKLRKL